MLRPLLKNCQIFYVSSGTNPDTNGTEEGVHISEVSLFQGLNTVHARTVYWGKKPGVLI